MSTILRFVRGVIGYSGWVEDSRVYEPIGGVLGRPLSEALEVTSHNKKDPKCRVIFIGARIKSINIVSLLK